MTLTGGGGCGAGCGEIGGNVARFEGKNQPRVSREMLLRNNWAVCVSLNVRLVLS